MDAATRLITHSAQRLHEASRAVTAQMSIVLLQGDGGVAGDGGSDHLVMLQGCQRGRVDAKPLTEHFPGVLPQQRRRMPV